MTDENIQEKEKTKPAKKQRGLGRGLNALFEDEEGIYPQPDPQGHTPGVTRRMAGIDQLEPGSFQPRRHIDQASIDELAASIKEHGILQPILVRPKPGFAPDAGVFEIIAGERRWRAAQKAHLHEVPVIVGTFADQAALEIGLIENLQREDLNAFDEAEGYKRLSEEFGHTQEQIAQKLGKSRSHVANMMRLLGLPDDVKALVKKGSLSAGHARAILAADEQDRSDFAHYVANTGMSVRETEDMVNAGNLDLSGMKKKSAGTHVAKDVDTIALEEEVGNRIGAKVSINMKSGGGGAMKITFKTLDQLDEVLHRLLHNPGKSRDGEP